MSYSSLIANLIRAHNIAEQNENAKETKSCNEMEEISETEINGEKQSSTSVHTKSNTSNVPLKSYKETNIATYYKERSDALVEIEEQQLLEIERLIFENMDELRNNPDLHEELIPLHSVRIEQLKCKQEKELCAAELKWNEMHPDGSSEIMNQVLLDTLIRSNCNCFDLPMLIRECDKEYEKKRDEELEKISEHYNKLVQKENDVQKINKLEAIKHETILRKDHGLYIYKTETLARMVNNKVKLMYKGEDSENPWEADWFPPDLNQSISLYLDRSKNIRLRVLNNKQRDKGVEITRQEESMINSTYEARIQKFVETLLQKRYGKSTNDSKTLTEISENHTSAIALKVTQKEALHRIYALGWKIINKLINIQIDQSNEVQSSHSYLPCHGDVHVKLLQNLKVLKTEHSNEIKCMLEKIDKLVRNVKTRSKFFSDGAETELKEETILDSYYERIFEANDCEPDELFSSKLQFAEQLYEKNSEEFNVRKSAIIERNKQEVEKWPENAKKNINKDLYQFHQYEKRKLRDILEMLDEYFYNGGNYYHYFPPDVSKSVQAGLVNVPLEIE